MNSKPSNLDAVALDVKYEMEISTIEIENLNLGRGSPEGRRWLGLGLSNMWTSVNNLEFWSLEFFGKTNLE